MSQLETGQFGGPLGGQDYQSHYSRTASLSGHQGNLDEMSQASEGSSGSQNVGNIERLISVGAGLGLALSGLKRGRLAGLALSAMGAGLLWRGLTGRCQCYAALGINTAQHNPSTAVPAGDGYKVEKTITVDRSPADLYRFWRRFENLPQVMRHLKNVETVDEQLSHWKAEGALGKDVEWDAEILNERENELIAWRSLPGGDIDTAGSVHFKPLSHNGGTEVTLSMKYNPPAGKLGAQVASLFGEGLEQKLDEDLCRFKQVMETGMAAAPDMARHDPLQGQHT